jgi:uncharacterized membrane protein YbhN (UPF0104 family)
MSPVAATAAVLLQQAVLLATGVALGLALAPRMLGAWTAAFPAGLLLTFAAALVLGVALLLPPALPALERILTRLVRRPVPWPTPPARQFAVYVLALALPWLAYGLAFWLFARSLLGAGAPGPLFCLAAFTASYVAGIVAVFAPGGIVVREAALVAALAPRVGAQNALLLAFGSRLWLVALEVVTALAIVALWRLARPASQP